MRLTYFHYLCAGDTALNHVQQFVAAAADLGHEVQVRALEPSTPESSSGLPGSSSAFLKSKQILRFLLHEPKKLMWNAPSYAKATKCLRQSSPDMVLVRSSLLTLASVLAARRSNIPVVLEVNSPAAEARQYFDQYLHMPVLPEAVERWRLRSADGITVVSTALKEFLVDRYELDAGKVSVVPNGADLAVFRPETVPDIELAGFSRDATIIGFIGSFEKWHGPELLRDMVLRVAKARRETRFLLVGDGPGRAEVEKALRPIAGRVLFTGRVPHRRIPGITALLDVAVMPESNFYGSPLKVIEWMAAGRAIVAPDYGPLCEIIDSGKEGLLFKKGQADDLVATVVRLVGDPELRQQLGEAANLRAVQSLSWSHNASRVIDTCQRAIESHSKR